MSGPFSQPMIALYMPRALKTNVLKIYYCYNYNTFQLLQQYCVAKAFVGSSGEVLRAKLFSYPPPSSPIVNLSFAKQWSNNIILLSDDGSCPWYVIYARNNNNITLHASRRELKSISLGPYARVQYKTRNYREVVSFLTRYPVPIDRFRGPLRFMVIIL